MGIPSHWQNEKLGSLATQITKGTTPTTAGFQYQSDGIPFIKVENIIDGQVALKSVTQFISPEAHSSLKRSQFQVGDVLFSIAGTIGKTALVDVSATPANTNQAVAIIRGVTGCFIPSFLKLQLQEGARRIQVDHARGGAMNNVSLTDLKGLTVSVPPIAEQKVIADKLDTLLAQVENTKARLERIPQILKRFRQSVLAAAVSGRLTEEWRNKNKVSRILNYKHECLKHRRQISTKKNIKITSLIDDPELVLPDVWTWQAIDEVCLKITDGTHHSPKSFPSGEYMYVTSKNVREGYLDLSNVTYIDEKTHREIYSRCDVKQDDVLYVKDGANTGLACVNSIKEEISLLSSVCVLKACSFMNNTYLQHYLNSPIGRKLMLDLMGGTAIKRLTLKKISSSPIAVPPIEEQAEIVRRVDQLFAHADRIESQVNNALARVNNLTQSILTKAFRGELTEQWRKDNAGLISGENSAEALLQRIKAERSQTKQARSSNQIKASV